MNSATDEIAYARHYCKKKRMQIEADLGFFKEKKLEMVCLHPTHCHFKNQKSLNGSSLPIHEPPHEKHQQNKSHFCVPDVIRSCQEFREGVGERLRRAEKEAEGVLERECDGLIERI